MASRFAQILKAIGSTVQYYAVKSDGTYEQPTDILAIITPARIDELVLEPGYVINDYITLYTNTALKTRDKIRWNDTDFLVLTVQPFGWKNETAFYKAQCRRLLA